MVKANYRAGLDILRSVNNQKFPQVIPSDGYYHTDIKQDVVPQDKVEELKQSQWLPIDGFWTFTGYKQLTGDSYES